jgi:hypothetical protein
MTTLVELSSHSILEGKEQSSIIMQSVEDFAHNQIKCTEPVDPAPSRSECTFNRNLPSTPAEEILLKGVDFDGFWQEDSAVSSTVATAVTSLNPENSSQELHDDDNTSRTSSGSISSLPSPRLKYRDANANHTDSNKSRKHKLPVMRTIRQKSGCPSGLPSPSNHQSHKRMKR